MKDLLPHRTMTPLPGAMPPAAPDPSGRGRRVRADRAGTAGIAERSVIHGKQTEVCSISTHPNAASPETRMTAGLPGMCFSFPLYAV